MDIANKPSVLETWQALKHIDDRDLRRGAKKCTKVAFSWNEFVKKDPQAEPDSRVLLEPGACLLSLEPRPFIIGTPKYQCTSGELRRVLESAAKDVLQRGDVNSEENKDDYSLSDTAADAKSSHGQEEQMRPRKQSFQRLEEAEEGSRMNYQESQIEAAKKLVLQDCKQRVQVSQGEGEMESSLIMKDKTSVEGFMTEGVEMKTFVNWGENTRSEDAAVTNPSPSHGDSGEGQRIWKDVQKNREGDIGIELKTFHRTECLRSSKASESKGFQKGFLSSATSFGSRTNSKHDHDLIKKLNADVNCLLDEKASVRHEALLSIHCILLGDYPGEVALANPVLSFNSEDWKISEGREETDSEGEEEESITGEKENKVEQTFGQGMFENAENFVDCVRETVTKSLLRRFGDSSEKCRLLSISLITSLLKASPPTVVSLMSYILPVMIERLPIKSLPNEEDSFGKIEILVMEPSEEVRLALVRLLHVLLFFARKKVKFFASEVASILTTAAMDSYPEVLMETSKAIVMFGKLCKQRLKPVAKQLISALLGGLSHKRYRIRLAALQAIHRLVLCGAHESIYNLTAYRDPNLVPIKSFYQPCPKTQYLALLASDNSLHVREELLKTIASWLRYLWERKEHECRLIPYLQNSHLPKNK